MPRKKYCPVCPRLYAAGERYPTIGDLGAPVTDPDRQEMRRIYSRTSTKAYQPIGYICDVGHVVLDEDEGVAGHVLTPTEPARVVCTSTGEVVSADREGRVSTANR